MVVPGSLCSKCSVSKLVTDHLQHSAYRNQRVFPRPVRIRISSIASDFSTNSDVEYRVPRVTVLGSFEHNNGKPEALITPGPVDVGTLKTHDSNLSALLRANVQAEIDLETFEAWAGRAAMVGLTVALVTELFEGREFFEFREIDHAILFGYLAFAQFALIAAVEFARFCSNVENSERRSLNDKLFQQLQLLRDSAAALTAVPVLDGLLQDLFADDVLD